MTLRSLTGFAAVLSAVASSACWWLPLTLVGLGMSSSLAPFFEGYRPLFLLAAVLLLGGGYYLNYIRRERCAAGTVCDPAHVRVRRMNRVQLWISTLLVAAFALFPQHVGALVEAPTGASPEGPQADTWTLHIEGMSCAGCEAAVNRSLTEVSGVLRARASHIDAQVIASVDVDHPPSRMAITAAVARSGYRLVSIATTPNLKSSRLEGHWVTELEDEPGKTTPLTMDLGIVNERWVGEFDLSKYGVVDYPMEVRVAADSVALHFSALAMSFQGAIGADGSLAGAAQSRGQEAETILFRRTGPAQFSAEFLRLEEAADDPSLIHVLSSGGSELRQQFNADRTKTRLLLLLSPTCPHCKRGARVVQDSVLSKINDENLVVYAVWEPILRTDDERSSRKATTLLPDSRVRHYWAGTRSVGEIFQQPLGLKTEPAWDVYLIYASGIEWNDEPPPAPTTFMHQLGGRLPAGLRLDGRALRDSTVRTLHDAARDGM